MRLPRKVDVVGTPYKVHIETRGTRNPALDDRPLGGCVVHTKQQIEIDGTNNAFHQRQVMTHEILHAVDAVTTDAESMLPERDIYRLAHGLDYVLSHNPEFLRMYAKGKS